MSNTAHKALPPYNVVIYVLEPRDGDFIKRSLLYRGFNCFVSSDIEAIGATLQNYTVDALLVDHQVAARRGEALTAWASAQSPTTRVMPLPPHVHLGELVDRLEKERLYPDLFQLVR